MSSASSYPPQPSALRLSAEQDHLDLIKHPPKNINRRRASNIFNIGKGYSESKLSVVINLRSRIGPEVYDLVFSAVPNGRIWDEPVVFGRGDIEPPPSHVDNSWGKDGMHRIAQFVEYAKRSIPSLMSIEPAKERFDLIRQVYASSAYQVVEVGCVSACNREVSGSGQHLATRERGSIASLIQARSKGEKCLSANIFGNVWNGFGESETVRVLASIRIELHASGVWAVTPEVLEDVFEFGNPIVCAVEPPLGTGE